MARFVLVHGAFAGAWIWQPVIDRLKAAGHSAEAFDLPMSSEATLETCADRLCEVLASNPEPAIVVGHSMGGVIATQGAARTPARVRALVYAAAFLPQNGQSLLELTQRPEGAGDQVQANITVAGDPPSATMPPEASYNALYGCCTEVVSAWATARHVPQPVGPFVTPVSIPLGALDAIARYYVLCTRDQDIPPALQRRMIAENPCADVVELATDHTPQLSMPEELAAALHRFATHAQASSA